MYTNHVFIALFFNFYPLHYGVLFWEIQLLMPYVGNSLSHSSIIPWSRETYSDCKDDLSYVANCNCMFLFLFVTFYGWALRKQFVYPKANMGTLLRTINNDANLWKLIIIMGRGKLIGNVSCIFFCSWTSSVFPY